MNEYFRGRSTDALAMSLAAYIVGMIAITMGVWYGFGFAFAMMALGGMLLVLSLVFYGMS